MNYYIIELQSENLRHTVRKVFTSIQKAEHYASTKCAFILSGDVMERVTSTTIIKVEMC